jgi:hypothetical protein
MGGGLRVSGDSTPVLAVYRSGPLLEFTHTGQSADLDEILRLSSRRVHLL